MYSLFFKETESGRGIMEEPELTLVSSNDVSVADSDTECTNQEEIKDKINNPASVDQSGLNIFTEVSLSNVILI